jgi:molecular chaperone GrpE
MEQKEEKKAEGTQAEGAEEVETEIPNETKEAPTKEEVDWKSKYYYLAADYENFRKRSEKERDDVRKFGSQNILSDLLQVVDNFERTTDMLKTDQDPKIKNIVTGIDMVNKQLLDTLGKYGLEQIEAIGKDFDPHFHEAMSQEYAEGKKPNEVIKEFQKGYILNGRVIRPSKVVVSSDKQ